MKTLMIQVQTTRSNTELKKLLNSVAFDECGDGSGCWSYYRQHKDDIKEGCEGIVQVSVQDSTK